MSALPPEDVDRIAKALGGRRQPEGSWLCRCPVPSHGQGKRDRHPSLSIAQGRGRVLVHCFAGCQAKEVLGELGRLTGKSDTWPLNRPINRTVSASTQPESQKDKVRHLWGTRRPIEGSIVETYLREIRRYHGPIPPTLGYLPPLRDGHHPALIAAFGLPVEPEPGRLVISSAAVEGVHLTLLTPGGTKAEVTPNKIMVGRSVGWPIVLFPPNDLLGMAITEGIEDALTLAEATGLGAWAAGSASRLRSLADKVPNYIDNVVVGADRDDTGQRHALSLRDELGTRGIHVEIRFPPSKGRAA